MQKVTIFAIFLFTSRETRYLKGIQNLDINKVVQESDMPSLNIKKISDIFLPPSFNDAITNLQANITPIFKEGERFSKNNYITVSISPNMSKVFEKSMFCQMSDYMDKFLSKLHCGFRKGNE